MSKALEQDRQLVSTLLVDNCSFKRQLQSFLANWHHYKLTVYIVDKLPPTSTSRTRRCFNNNHYYWFPGWDISKNYTSENCKNPKKDHTRDGTRTTTMLEINVYKELIPPQ